MPDSDEQVYVSTVNGHWVVRQQAQGHEKPFPTRKEALDHAIDIAKASNLDVRVIERDGTSSTAYKRPQPPSA